MSQRFAARCPPHCTPNGTAADAYIAERDTRRIVDAPLELGFQHKPGIGLKIDQVAIAWRPIAIAYTPSARGALTFERQIIWSVIA